MGISVVLLAYKEAENLKVLLPQIKKNVEKTGENYEILIIDTMETMDDTPAVCKEHGAKYINQEEPYFGGAFRTGIKYASMDKFLILDSDGSHSPKYIPRIYKKFVSGHYDLVIGSRYCKGGVTNDSISSRIMSKILNTTYRLVLGIQCNYYDVLQEVILKLKLKNKRFKIGEVPIKFYKRMYGDSKRQLVKFIISYMKTLFYLIGVRVKGDK